MVPPPSSDATLPRLLLTAGDRRLELDPGAVEEVCRTGRILPVPGAAPWLCGLAAWRGRVVTLVDAGRLHGTRPATGAWMAVLKGLPVDAALRLDGDPRLADRADGEAVLVLDRAALADLPALQPDAARPRAPVRKADT